MMARSGCDLAILACNGLDKAEGAVAREVAMRLAENRLLVVDGCATQCAAKLAAVAGTRPASKLVVSEYLEKTGRHLVADLRLDTEALELGADIAVTLAKDTTAPRGVWSKRAPAVTADTATLPEVTLETAATGPEGTTSVIEPVPVAPSDFLVITYDKYQFQFHIPREGFYFNPNDVWAQVAGRRARVGLSDYLQQRLSYITYVDPPAVGTAASQFDELGTVESTKANFEVVSPVSGVVQQVNSQVCDDPALINKDPYGAWIVELELTDWKEDQALLMDAEAYVRDLERKAAEC